MKNTPSNPSSSTKRENAPCSRRAYLSAYTPLKFGPQELCDALPRP